ncbi:segregation/condensation protein A [bacterium]|nr:segregation/condensation protein A [bacterium]
MIDFDLDEMNALDHRCRVKLEQFEGPLDLLLYLIKKDEIDIYDIPIVYVTQQYIDYLNLMKKINLDIAGEYLVMAATLLEIKSKMLLPKPTFTEEGEEEEDPRDELVAMLMEYQKYKNVAELLRNKASEESEYYIKGSFPEISYKPEESVLSPMSFYDLIKLAYEILEEPKKEVPNILREGIDIEERIDFVINIMKAEQKLQFVELFNERPTPVMLVATFIAVLELVRRHNLRLKQFTQFGSIWLYLIENK